MSLTLLTGSNGFLGKYIFNENIEKLEIHTLNRLNSDYNYDLGREIPLFFNDFKLVIHAAGKAHSFPTSDFEKSEFYQSNVIGTLNLLNGLSKNCTPEKFVYISSVSVYGLNQGENINEKSPLYADDAYGRSKIDAEGIIEKWCEENRVICTILRLPLVVGLNPPGNLGSMIKGVKNGYYFDVADGKAKKSMVLASDIAKFILLAAEVGGIYNLTDGCHPKFGELSRLISKQLGKRFVPNMPLFVAKLLAFIGDKMGPVFPINSDKLSKITSTLTFDDSKARKAFGWNPTPVLKGFRINE